MQSHLDNILLRPAAMNDIEQLVIVENQCFTKYYKPHRFTDSQFRYYLENPLATTIVAIKNNCLAGYVLGLNQRGRLKKTARLYSIAVLPDERNKGIGKHLVSEFIELVKDRGAEHIVLEVAEKNQIAIKLFKDIGFCEIRSLKNYYGKGINGKQMKY